MIIEYNQFLGFLQYMIFQFTWSADKLKQYSSVIFVWFSFSVGFCNQNMDKDQQQSATQSKSAQAMIYICGGK